VKYRFPSRLLTDLKICTHSDTSASDSALILGFGQTSQVHPQTQHFISGKELSSYFKPYCVFEEWGFPSVLFEFNVVLVLMMRNTYTYLLCFVTLMLAVMVCVPVLSVACYVLLVVVCFS